MQFVAIYLLFTCSVSCLLLVTSCPTGCSCSAGKVLCSTPTTGTPLMLHIPLDIPANTTELFILRQNITRIRREDFQNLRNLQRLGVRRSNVQIIDNDAFQYLTELRELFLDDNMISTINRHTLMGLNELFRLGIQDNPDLVVDPCTLSSLNRLTHLFLCNTSVTFNLSLWEDCEDQSISPAVYGIRHLLIGGEGAHIAGDVLVNLSALQTLYILNPPVDLLMGYNISSMESLSHLRLYSLTFFPRDFLISDSLRIIIIYLSSFTHLPAYAFTNVSTLARCIIGNSDLMYVHKDAFSGLTSLTYLSLPNNKIQTLPVGLLTDISSPVNVYLYNNPWNCNCSLYWLLGEENEQITAAEGTCASPPALAGVPLTEVGVNITAPCDQPMTSPELTPTPHTTSRTIGHSSPSSPQSAPPSNLTTSTNTNTALLEHPELPRGESSLLKNWTYLALAVAVVLIILLAATSLVCWIRATGTRRNKEGIDSGDSAFVPSRDSPGIQMKVQSSRNIADPANSGADDYYEVGDSSGEVERRADDQIPEDSFEDSGGAASNPIAHNYFRNNDQIAGYERQIQHRDGTVHVPVYERNIDDSGGSASQPIVHDYSYITS